MKELVIRILRGYQKFISPTLKNLFGGGCRFTPTCSEYTIEALGKYGTLKGLSLGAKRLARCHPLGGFGFDPVK